MKTLTLLLTLTLSNIAYAYSHQDKLCLARNIYHEARGEPLRGKLAVAQVTLNRYKSNKQRFKNLCAVIYQPFQFSWTHMQHKHLDVAAWLESVKLANQILRQGYALKNFTATHFHASYINPRWSHSLEPVAYIGQHIFYR